MPDQYGDWLNQRDDSLRNHPLIGSKAKTETTCIFSNYSSGLKTQRDAWCYNSSHAVISANMERMIGFYNRQVERLAEYEKESGRKLAEAQLDAFSDHDPHKLSWTHSLKQALFKQKVIHFDKHSITSSLYRPFTKQWLYYNRHLNERVYQIPRVFSDGYAENRVIQINTNFKGDGFLALISTIIPDLHCNGDSQCFPLYLYDEPRGEETKGNSTDDLFATPSERQRRDAITDAGLAHFQAAYPGETISKEDLFYYIYGLLHAPDYREQFADNLTKELPRIPAVKQIADFRAFSQAGRALAELHLNYETVPPYKAEVEDNSKGKPENYRVEKMRYGKNGKEKDLSTIVYNEHITVRGIPLSAYDYVVNGKSAIDWVVERQSVRTDKASGIVNDANDWAIETMHNPRYPLELLLRVVTVSLETMKIVNSLPELDIG